MLATMEKPSHLNSELQRVSQQAEKVGILARMVAWTIGDKVMLRRKDVIARVAQAGLPSAVVTKKLRERETVIRALKELQKEGFLHPVTEDEQRAVWILVKDEVDERTETVDFQEKYRFTYFKRAVIDPATGTEIVAAKTLKANDPAVQQELNELVEHFSDLYLPRDIRALMTRAVKAASGLPFRDRGGVYFVPRQKFELVEAMGTFLNGIPGCDFRVLNIPDLQEDRETLLATFDKNFNKELEDIREEIVKMVTSDTNVRKGTFQDRIEQVMSKMGQLNMFSELLQFKTEEYETTLHELREFIFEQME